MMLAGALIARGQTHAGSGDDATTGGCTCPCMPSRLRIHCRSQKRWSSYVCLVSVFLRVEGSGSAA